MKAKVSLSPRLRAAAEAAEAAEAAAAADAPRASTTPVPLVVQAGDSAHGGPGPDPCRQTCSGPGTTYLLQAGRTSRHLVSPCLVGPVSVLQPFTSGINNRDTI